MRIAQNKARIALFSIFMVLSISTMAKDIPLPKNEIKTINQVANEYNLTQDQKTLLFVIRIIENGNTPKEFGVLTPQAMRFNDPDKSFITQARWAAGTIKKRYNGNLKEFSKRWCPIGAKNDPTNLNKNWYPNAKYWMDKLNKEVTYE